MNGYSDWQVLYKDEMNGTIDVVSKNNTENLTLEYGQSKEYYENKFQETANKYVDNNYVLSSRTVDQNDLELFKYDDNFWLNKINDTHITTSKATWEYNPINYKMFVIPYVEKYFENYNDYNAGDVIEYSNNGVDRWVVVDKWDSSLLLIPETPIELVIESVDDNINEKANQIIASFNNDVSNRGDYLNSYGPYNLPNLIPSFLNQQKEKILFYNSNCYSKEDNIITTHCGGIPYYKNGTINFNYGTIYTDTSVPYILGYRPVLTLKVKKEMQDKDKKEISSKLKVGDNVKYEAKGYKNWKVLSIDNDLGTVDIISGGIVKNITLSGKEDWDNYEDIIQREVDEYKNGEQAKKATTVTSSHLKTLKEIDKSILSEYWLLSKNSYFKGKDGYSIKYYYYCISTYSQFKIKDDGIHLNIIPIYANLTGAQEEVERYKNSIYITSVNSSSYTAGLRPVITLKLDNVEKLPEEETKKIEESTEKQEKIFIKEQESKNKNYKGPKTVDNSTSSTGNNEVKTNDKDNTKKDNITDNNTSNVEKIVYKDKPLYKYGFIIFLITSIIELIIIMLLLKKIKR